MGFGKWVLGGVCAVGAVIAAPVPLSENCDEKCVS